MQLKRIMFLSLFIFNLILGLQLPSVHASASEQTINSKIIKSLPKNRRFLRTLLAPSDYLPANGVGPTLSSAKSIAIGSQISACHAKLSEYSGGLSGNLQAFYYDFKAGLLDTENISNTDSLNWHCTDESGNDSSVFECSIRFEGICVVTEILGN